MSNEHRWYVARYRSVLPWRRYVVVRWVHDASGDGSWLGPGRFEFLDRHGGEEYRGYWLTEEGAQSMADFANWRDEFHEREVRYDERQ